jgi:lipoprotein-anchoring transpeptidase ErfK/SrfK
MILAISPEIAVAAPAERLVINLPAFQLRLYRGDQLVREYPISIGDVVSQTPLTSPNCKFEVGVKVVDPVWYPPGGKRPPVPAGRSNPLGTRWLGLTEIVKVNLKPGETLESIAARYKTTVSAIRNRSGLTSSQSVETGQSLWVPFSPGYGVHGTIVPTSIGHSVSLGCMRMRNPDVEALYPLVPVGTPVELQYVTIVPGVDPFGITYLKIYKDVYRRGVNTVASIAAALEDNSMVTNADRILRAIAESDQGVSYLAEYTLVELDGQVLSAAGFVLNGEPMVPLGPLAAALKVDLYEGSSGVTFGMLTVPRAIDTPNGFYAPASCLPDIGVRVVNADTIAVVLSSIAG